MSIINRIIGNTTHRLYLKKHGLGGQFGFIDDFRKLSKLNSYDLAEHQQKGLENILMHAYRNCPYYKRIFFELGATPMDFETFEKLKEFPILTRDELRDNLDQILAENYPMRRRVAIHTAGTSGDALNLYMDRSCRDMKNAMELLLNMRCGYRPGDRILCLYAPDDQAYGSGPARLFGSRKWYLDIDAIQDEKELASAVSFIKKLNPDFVFAYPNSLYTFAGRLERAGKYIKLKKIVCSSEPFYEYQRDYFRKCFKAWVYDRYGAAEIGWVASECRIHSGMHYFAPGIILETADRQGNSSGLRPGSLLVTDLWNYAMPLIRYKIGDFVRLDYTRCKCGGSLPKIGRVIGRIDDAIIKPDGEMLNGNLLLSVLRESELNSPVQIVQNDLAEFVINYVSERTLSENIRRYITSSFARLFEQEVKVDFVQTNALQKDSGGRYRNIRSNVKSSLKV